MFQPIKSLILNSVTRAGIKPEVDASLVVVEFEKLIYQTFGHKNKSKIKAMYFTNNVLTVACLDPVFASELRFNEDLILKKLRKKFLVNRIRYIL
jgi:hypothetical protein